MADNFDTCCSICGDEEDNGDETQLTSLDCGHSFHSACIIEWFRFYAASCPNCRSDGVMKNWTMADPVTRVEHLRHCRGMLCPMSKRKLDTMDRQQKRLRALKKEHSEFKCVHAGVLKKSRAFARNLESLESKVDILMTELSTINVRGSALAMQNRG